MYENNFQLSNISVNPCQLCILKIENPQILYGKKGKTFIPHINTIFNIIYTFIDLAATNKMLK